MSPKSSLSTPSAPVDRSSAAAEFAAWLAKYGPVERAIIEARERRLANAARRREDRAYAFGSLCEATEGLAVAWRRAGSSAAEMLAWADGDLWTLQCLLPFLRRGATLAADVLRHRAKRPLYYAAENARRRRLAAERRRIRRRTTLNPCPTREAILDAWIHVRESKEALVRFGSLVEDLECYVDNSLLRDEDGEIVGRRAGIKGWLRENIPALALRYTTVMRYKAAARKARQIAGIADPVPATALLEDAPAEPDSGARADADGLARARAAWRTAMEGVPDVATQVLARIEELVAPGRGMPPGRAETDPVGVGGGDGNEITVRTKSFVVQRPWGAIGAVRVRRRR